MRSRLKIIRNNQEYDTSQVIKEFQIGGYSFYETKNSIYYHKGVVMDLIRSY